MRGWVTLGVFAASLSATSAFALGCVRPSPPPLPDPATVDAATRNAVTAQVEAYIVATNTYLACVEQADEQARAEAERIIQTWTAPVTDLQVVTD